MLPPYPRKSAVAKRGCSSGEPESHILKYLLENRACTTYSEYAKGVGTRIAIYMATGMAFSFGKAVPLRRCTMATTTKPLLALTTSDLMTRNVITIPHEMSLRAAAKLLFENKISGAPVVDADGRCIGVLCGTDLVHWIEEGGQGAEDVPLPACPYQVKGRLLTGEQAMICTLAGGSCPLQDMRPTTGGRHTAVCLLPSGAVSDWQHIVKKLPTSGVRRYMTADVVTVGPQTPLPKLARTMIDAHIHRVIVVDDERRPVGVVSSTDLMAAMAYADGEQSP
jgi:CBS domain-containing protein